MAQSPPPSDAALALLDQDAARPLRDVIRHGAPHQRAVAAAIMFISLFLGVMLIYTGAAGSITGSTQAFLPSLVESMKDDTSGTIAPRAAGSGERTVRAHSQAMTVASDPSASRAFGYR